MTDVLLAFPFVILAIGLAAILGPSLTTTTIALGIAAVPGLRPGHARRDARAPRGGLRPRRGRERRGRRDDRLPAHPPEHDEHAARLGDGARSRAAIIGEATLSFLGLGVRPPTPSWGAMLHDAQSYLSQAPRLAVYPGLAIVIAALAFNLLGDGLRDILDPRTTR